MSASSSTQSAAIRRATADDLGAIQQLFYRRFGRPWEEAGIRWLMFNLDPTRCVVWLAWEGDKPIGLNSIFLRRLELAGASHHVAYWNNLYIDPDYRHLMLYPRLPLVMFEWIRHEQLAFLYGSVRRQDVAKAHLSIGFTKCGTWRVLAQPLRPARLIAKHKSWGSLMASVGAPLDVAYGWLQAGRRKSLSTGVRAVEVSADGAESVPIADLLNLAGAGLAAQRWSHEALAYRYSQDSEGRPYHILTAQEGGQVRAAVIYCFAQRGNRIRTAVVMDVVMQPGAGNELAGLLHDHLAREASRRGCELVIFLNGLGAPVEEVFRRCGYRDSPECYDLIIWPAQAMQDHAWCGDIRQWRFAFGDHDAF